MNCRGQSKGAVGQSKRDVEQSKRGGDYRKLPSKITKRNLYMQIIEVKSIRKQDIEFVIGNSHVNMWQENEISDTTRECRICGTPVFCRGRCWNFNIPYQYRQVLM